jgi:hypothetical protein
MAIYKVNIYERIIHSIEVEAPSGEKAKEKAYDLISNTPEYDLLLNYEYGYSIDGEYMGIEEVEEV